MTDERAVAAIMVAGGRGTRMGGEPKQFRRLAGVPVLLRAARALRAHGRVGRIVAMVPGERVEEARALLASTKAEVVAGGETRRASVAAGMATIGETDGAVLVHDAARPDLPGEVVDRLLAALAEADGAAPVLPMVDTLVERDSGGVVDRDRLARVQTPQAFALPRLRAAHAAWTGSEPTDDAQMVRAAGGRVALVDGDERLAKLTRGEDFRAAERRMGERVSVTGTGFDVHRLEVGESLWLCGVELNHSHGLSGHSDADVGLHALTDALLGAIGAGDIGDHFPPTDERWRGARSDRFLAHAVQLATEAGARLEHLDLTLICEAPKIGPHKAVMRTRIAAIVGVNQAQVSVKATTTEALGFAGRREGIAAQAAVTVSRWRTA